MYPLIWHDFKTKGLCYNELKHHSSKSFGNINLIINYNKEASRLGR